MEYQYSGGEEEDEEADTGTSRNNIPGEATLRQNFLKLQLQEENKKQKENEEKRRKLIEQQR